MEFPKPLMTIKELGELGFSEKLMREIALKQGYPLAIREKASRTSAIKIDTAELTKYLRITSKVMERR